MSLLYRKITWVSVQSVLGDDSTGVGTRQVSKVVVLFVLSQ